MATELDPHTCKKRRGVLRVSITRLSTRLKELESKIEQPNTLELAQRIKQKLETQDSKFKVHHCALIDLIDDEETLQKEQDITAKTKD